MLDRISASAHSWSRHTVRGPCSGFLRGEDRGLPGLGDVPWAPDGARGVEGQDLADDEPVEEHPKGREVLLDGRRRARPGELLDVGRNHHRLDLVEGEAYYTQGGGHSSGSTKRAGGTTWSPPTT